MGRNPQKLKPSDRELDVMTALWELSEGTVAELRIRLAGLGHELAYNTVQTLLNRLVEKGHVAREKTGRSYRYRPILRRPAAAGRAVRSLVERFFGGSAEALAQHLVASGLEHDELDRLQRTIEGRAR
jgi:BlaI family transcriptional regulator, penicillinase repressor